MLHNPSQKIQGLKITAESLRLHKLSLAEIITGRLIGELGNVKSA